MLTHSIAQATEKVYVTSPYFVPDRPFRDAMISAALRGVDVRVLVPEESDHWIVGLAALGSFERLIEAGVQIYRYDKGFIHAKTLVIDDWFASVGSANMDSRSFHLNFELNVFVFGSAFSKALTDQFLLDLHDLSPLTVDVVRGQSYGRRMLGAIARLASPLL